MKQEYETKSLEDAKSLASKIAKNLQKGDIIALKGDLGAGKTYLASEIIKELLSKDIEVTSPTFQLLQTYDHIHHYDLYRLKHPEEIYEIGLEDSLDGSKIVIIEWPEIIMHLLPQDIIEIDIKLEDNNRRYVINRRIG